MEQVLGLKEVARLEHGFYNAQDTATVTDAILMNQVHSADVLVIDKPLEYPPQVDALITKTPNLRLSVKTADCAPVLIYDAKAKMIAAIHAGWRGAFQGIIENTILKMLELGGDVNYMIAGIGPHIQQKSFQADEKMKALFPVTEYHFFTPTGEGYLFDFHAYVVHRLQRARIKHIDSVKKDTFADNSYFSYRRDPKNPGRQYSCIMLTK